MSTLQSFPEAHLSLDNEPPPSGVTGAAPFLPPDDAASSFDASERIETGDTLRSSSTTSSLWLASESTPSAAPSDFASSTSTLRSPAATDATATARTTRNHDPKKDPNHKPPTLPVLPENVPTDLTTLPQWVRWRWCWDDKRAAWTKVPIQPSRPDYASSTDKNTWGAFQVVVSNLGMHRVDGIGFVFTTSDPFCGIDLDSCRDPLSGDLSSEAHRIVQELQGYAELSVTSTGVHVIVRASLGALRGKKSGFIEVYDSGRYFTVTGQVLVTPEVRS